MGVYTEWSDVHHPVGNIRRWLIKANCLRWLTEKLFNVVPEGSLPVSCVQRVCTKSLDFGQLCAKSGNCDGRGLVGENLCEQTLSDRMISPGYGMKKIQVKLE